MAFFSVFCSFFVSFCLPQQHAKKINPGEALPSVLHSLWSNFLTKFSKSNTHNTIVTRRRSLGKILPALRELPRGQTGYAVSWHPTVLLVGLVVCDTWISLTEGLKHESLILASSAREGGEDTGGFLYLIQTVVNTNKPPQMSPRIVQQSFAHHQCGSNPRLLSPESFLPSLLVFKQHCRAKITWL